MKFDIETDGTTENTRIVESFDSGDAPIRLTVDDAHPDFSTLYLLAGTLGMTIDFYRDDLGGFTHISIHANTEIIGADDHSSLTQADPPDRIIPFRPSRR